ncbi:MAG: hypothetical protein LBE20_00045, partial [Deltaproteobacteria bacterium]|nr:hypothetical protein [Deltaproteobacteria bacterium]
TNTISNVTNNPYINNLKNVDKILDEILKNESLKNANLKIKDGINGIGILTVVAVAGAVEEYTIGIGSNTISGLRGLIVPDQEIIDNSPNHPNKQAPSTKPTKNGTTDNQTNGIDNKDNASTEGTSAQQSSSLDTKKDTMRKKLERYQYIFENIPIGEKSQEDIDFQRETEKESPNETKQIREGKSVDEILSQLTN